MRHVLLVVDALAEAPLDDGVGVDKRLQHRVGRAEREPEGVGKRAQREGAAGAHPAAHELGKRIGDGGHLRCHPRWNRHAEAVAQQRCVERLRDVFPTADAHPHHARPERRLESCERHRRVDRELVHGHRAGQAQGVGELFRRLGAAHPAQVRVDLGDHFRVQQFAQLHGTQQFGQQRRVQRERRRSLLCKRGVALVHERAGVVEQQR